MKPALMILAAGMGSRYGGLKQLDGVGPQGQTIMDYSVFDAIRAGFNKVVFVIRKDFEQDFRQKVLSKYEGHIDTEVVFQSVDALPEGFTAPEGRTKPWGTNHAIMMGAGVLKQPFAVINADDFYGREAFKVMADYLSKLPEDSADKYCMLAYQLGNTMTENGSVSRGVCSVNDKGYLTGVTERTAISFDADGKITFTDENGQIQHPAADTPVSMNFWGFTPDYFTHSDEAFVKFLLKNIDSPKGEFYIPSVVDNLIQSGQATVEVLRTTSKWFGVTYPEDRQGVVDTLAALHAKGEYPDVFFQK